MKASQRAGPRQRPAGQATQQQKNPSRWREAIRSLILAGSVVTVFWATVVPAGSGSRIIQVILASVATAGATCSAWVPRAASIVAAASTGAAWFLGMTYDPFIIVGIALFTVAERSAAQLFPRILTGSVVVVLLILLTFTAEGNEERVRSALLSGAVLVASWVLGARTRQVRQEAGARARSEERMRMAREVHDALSQALGLIGMRAGVAAHVPALDEQHLREELRQIEETARTGTAELKALLQRQRDNSPEATQGTDQTGTHRESLEQRLSDVARIAEELGVAASVEVTGPVETLPEAVRVTVYSVAREATTNAVRHSSASAVAIAVRFRDDGVRVRVSDNGTGNTSCLREGNGITGMRERASLLSGTLTLTDRRGGGLTVLMELPHPASGKRRDTQ